jgi:DNA-binding transcriptional MerR regulator
MTDERGRYRINWVAEQTGIAESTLRAWERRYGVPEPERTPSGYRIYSTDDVKKVQRMRELCAGGMSPSEAAHAVAAGVQAERPRVVDNAGEVRLSEVLGPQHLDRSGAVSLHGVLTLMERAATVLCSGSLRRAAMLIGCGPLRMERSAHLGDTVTTTARFSSASDRSVVIDVELSVEHGDSTPQRLAAGNVELLLIALPTQSETDEPA